MKNAEKWKSLYRVSICSSGKAISFTHLKKVLHDHMKLGKALYTLGYIELSQIYILPTKNSHRVEVKTVTAESHLI